MWGLMEARYSRLASLPEIGQYGLDRLASATIAIIGCGGLGTVSAELLARFGIGNLHLIDDDCVEPANLAGQHLFDEQDAFLSQYKVQVAARRLSRCNSDITIKPIVVRIDEHNAEDMLRGVDLVLDGTDNDLASFIINRACLRLSIPWIYAAVLECYGLVMNIIPGETQCFVCTFGIPEDSGVKYNQKGYLSTVTEVVAALQVNQALRVLLGDGGYMRGLLYIDTWEPGLERLDIRSPERGCPACGRGQN